MTLPLPGNPESAELSVSLTDLEARLAAIDSGGELDLESFAALADQLTRLDVASGDERFWAAIIGFQHSFLNRMLDSADLLLERVVARLAEGDVNEGVRGSLLQLFDHLGRGMGLHFEHEERAGGLVRALEAEPRFHRRAERLFAEHRDFLACAADLQRRALGAERSTQRWRRVRDDFQGMRAALAEHERAESEIVQSAWMDDLGGRG